jgi:hypothetical protein
VRGSMRLAGCRFPGPISTSRGARNTLFVLCIAALMIGSATAATGGGAGGVPASGSPLHTAASGPPPVIYSFSAFPSEFFQGSGTSFSVGAYSPAFDPLSYSYGGLPAGCSNIDSSFLPCSPIGSGSFNVSVTVTDEITLATAVAYTTIYVDPVVTGSFFTINPNAVQVFPVNFSANGLPFGTPWQVSLGTDLQNSTSTNSLATNLTFSELDGTFDYSVGAVPGYEASPPAGTVSVAGSGQTVFIYFFPVFTSPITFNETGLPLGTPWNVTLNGATLTGVGNITFFEPFAIFPYLVGAISGFNATPSSGVAFAGGLVSVVFTSSSIVAYVVTLGESGLPFGTPWNVTLNGTLYATDSPTLQVAMPNGVYPFTFAAIPGYHVAPHTGSVTISGANPAPVVATYSLAPVYAVTVDETGLPAGTPWSATFQSVLYDSSTASVVLSLPTGTYTYNVGTSALGAVPGFVESPQNGKVTVSAAPKTVHVTFTRVSTLDAEDTACSSIPSPPFYQNFCSPEAVSPTLLSLPSGGIGLASELSTNSTLNTCAGAAANTVDRVGFALSTNGGVSFGPTQTLGNDSCTFFNAVEPTFAASGSNVYGAYIQENSLLGPPTYGGWSTDALGFVRSTNDGSSFIKAQTLDFSGNLARPTIAAFGSTVYVVVENIANGSTRIGGNVLPISLLFLYSTNGGVSWHAPVRLPGLGASSHYTSMSPALAVNATGTLAVVYASNRTCHSTGPGSGCSAYEDSIVLLTSGNNGTSWTGPQVLARDAGETLCTTGACDPYFFESTPQIAASFAPSGDPLYVAYSATYNQGISTGNWNHTGLFAATWNPGEPVAGGPVVAPTGSVAVRSFNPGIAVSSNGAYITYLQANESVGTSSFANSLSQWVVTAPSGSTAVWSPPTAIDIESFASGGAVNSTRSSFAGLSSSVAIGPGGLPLVAFALPNPPTTTIAHGVSFYDVNTTYPTYLAVGSLAVADAPNTVSVTFQEQGLPAGSTWGFTIAGLQYTLTTPQIEITNIPANLPLLVGASYAPGYWEILTTYFNATLMSFSFSSTFVFSFEVWAGVEFNTFPSGPEPWLELFGGDTIIGTNLLSSPFGAYASGTWEQYNEFIFPGPYPIYNDISYFGYSYSGSFFSNFDVQCLNSLCNYTTPWYFPLGSTIELQVDELAYSSPPPTYWTGQGAGSYTGPMQGFCFDYFECPVSTGPITVLGPTNETLWWGSAPSNLAGNVTLVPSGLPSTSVYSATLDGATLTGNDSAPATVSDVSPGAHSVTDVWATSATPGWEYFGSVAGPDPFVVPIESQVNLTFTSYVNLSASPGRVSFEAVNLPTGTSWSIDFNGSTYDSSTPWINVSSRPGSFALQADTATNANGTTGFLPTTAAEQLSVVPGHVYPISYAPAYQLLVLASAGGLVAAGGSAQQSVVKVWEPAGRGVSLNAVVSGGYVFEGWAGSGPGSYSGSSLNPSVIVSGPTVESASFTPLPGARFNLTVAAEGLPAGTWWSADLDGVGHASNQTAIVVGNLWPWGASGLVGHYRLSVPTVYENGTDLVRYVAAPTYPTYVGTNGSLTPPTIIAFTPQVYLQLASSGQGAVEATYLNGPLGLTAWLPQGAAVSISALPDPGATFAYWQGSGSGSYSGPNASVTIVANEPIGEVAVFVPVVVPAPPQYTLTIDLASSVESGTAWGVTFGGVGYTSTGANLTIPGLTPATYGMLVTTVNSPDGLIQYHPTPSDPVAYTVSGNDTLSISLVPYYWVSLSASVGGTVTPGSGYYPANTILYVAATANTTYTFAGWSGTGTGSYSGSNATASVLVTGPLTEVASFTQNSLGPAAASVWSSPETWIGLGAVGLIAGLVVGVLFARAGTSSAAPSSRSSADGRPRSTVNGGNR